jgi:hypothetical protein
MNQIQQIRVGQARPIDVDPQPVPFPEREDTDSSLPKLTPVVTFVGFRTPSNNDDDLAA